MNYFLSEAFEASNSNLSRTENNAIAFKSTGSKLVDQFGEAGSHRGRTFNDVFGDQETLDSIDRRSAVKFIFYLRMITRKYEDFGVNRGQGARDESFKRLLYYVYKDPNIFYNNLGLMTYVGSFRDIWDIIVLAELNGINLDLNRIFDLYNSALSSDQKDLALKYLPQITSEAKAKTKRAKIRNRVAKAFARFLGLDFQAYRQIKTEGTAHNWQQAISHQDFKAINFDHIPGRALSRLVSTKFLANQKLEKAYDAWIQSQPVAKFTGYPYELGKKVYSMRNYNFSVANMKPYEKMTIDKQFKGLLDLARQEDGGLNGNVWVAVDTSGSMTEQVANGSTSAYNVAVSLGIYFSALNEGAFKDQIVMFDNKSTLMEVTGEFTDKYAQIVRANTAWGGTNFQSVIDLLVNVRSRNPQIPLEDYPETLLVVSDMQFNPTGTSESNHAAAMRKLARVFPQEYVNKFKVVWWRVTGRRSGTFSSTLDDGGTYFVSGFDGAVITTILGGEEVVDDRTGKVRQPTAEERVEAALTQPVLELVQV